MQSNERSTFIEYVELPWSAFRQCFTEGKPIGERKTSMMYGLLVLFVLVQFNFWLVEVPRHENDVMRSGLNASVLTMILLTLYVCINFVDAYLSCIPRVQAFSIEKRKKLLVHTVELLWGTVLFGLLLGVILYTYATQRPSGCSLHFITLDEYVYPTLATRTEGLPESIDGYTIVNPGTHVLTLSLEETLKLTNMDEDCLFQNLYWAELCAGFLFSLYAFELFYLLQYIRVTLMIHHLFTFGVFYAYTAVPQSTLTAILAILQFFFAATEQPTFIALILYRLSDNKRLHSRWFMIGAVSFLVTKLIPLIMTIALMVAYRNELPLALIPIWTLLLCVGGFSQGYSAYVQFCIAQRSRRQLNNSNVNRAFSTHSLSRVSSSSMDGGHDMNGTQKGQSSFDCESDPADQDRYDPHCYENPDIASEIPATFRGEKVIAIA